MRYQNRCIFLALLICTVSIYPLIAQKTISSFNGLTYETDSTDLFMRQYYNFAGKIYIRWDMDSITFENSTVHVDSTIETQFGRISHIGIKYHHPDSLILEKLKTQLLNQMAAAYKIKPFQPEGSKTIGLFDFNTTSYLKLGGSIQFFILENDTRREFELRVEISPNWSMYNMTKTLISGLPLVKKVAGTLHPHMLEKSFGYETIERSDKYVTFYKTPFGGIDFDGCTILEEGAIHGATFFKICDNADSALNYLSRIILVMADYCGGYVFSEKYSSIETDFYLPKLNERPYKEIRNQIVNNFDRDDYIFIGTHKSPGQDILFSTDLIYSDGYYFVSLEYYL